MYFVDCFYCHICIFIKIFITPLCLLYPSRVTIVLQTEKWSTVIVLNDTVYLNGCMSLWEYKILGRGIVAQKIKYIHNFERIIKISMYKYSSNTVQIFRSKKYQNIDFIILINCYIEPVKKV